MSIGLLKSQDVLLLCKLVVSKDGDSLKQKDLSSSLGINQSEVSTGMERLMRAHLIDPETKSPNKLSVIDFLISGVKFFFPAEITEYALGIPTSIFAKPLADKLIEKGVPLVWQSPEGTIKGMSINPIHESVPLAAKNDERLYALLTALDALRTFRHGRVKEEASHIIRKFVLGNKHE